MPLFSLIILALVQGITEFLPISSSGHLVLTHRLLEGESIDVCWTQNRMIDVAVHVGTLGSVLVYYRKDVLDMLTGFFRAGSPGQALGFKIILASIPAICAGFVMHMMRPDFVCLLSVMAWATLVFGILLWIADRFFTHTKTLAQMSYVQALLIGCAQVFALIPGTSRSGVTMTAALCLGYSRTEAARFSILLALIVITGAGTLSALDLVESGDLNLGLDVLIAAVLSFFAGWAAIALMIKWLEKRSFTPFAVYRIILGVSLLALIYTGVL